MTTADTSRTQTRTGLLEDFVRSRTGSLFARLERGDSAARASLARLRRAAGREIAAHPGVWGDFYDGFPAELVGSDDGASAYENAAFVTLTLFALHQQAQSRSMQVGGPAGRLGSAVRRLATPNDPEEFERAVLRRFQMLVTAEEFSEIVHHLRGLVQLLKNESIPLDHGRLAADLAALQLPGRATRVRLQWARDLYSAPRARSQSTS